MALEFICTDQGTMAPVLFCDYCHLRIERAADGNVEYRYSTTDKRTSYLKFLHKKCDRGYRHYDPDDPLNDSLWMWSDLPSFLDHLAHNTGHRLTP